MAVMLRLRDWMEELVEESYNLKNEANDDREYEFSAAVAIQSWFRACRVRVYLKYLNKHAVVIQKNWRAFLDRRYFRALVKNSVAVAAESCYNRMAAKIQSAWRSYYVRKYVFDYYSYKQYMDDLKIKNEIVRSDLKEYAEFQAAARQRLEEQQLRTQREEDARRHHHLLSTRAIPGVYNNPDLPPLLEKEQRLRKLRFRPRSKAARTRTQTVTNPAWTGYNSHLPQRLPPLPPTVQGPFLPPAVVQQQRFKPFKPTLRVATDFYGLRKAREALRVQQWITGFQEERFHPFSTYHRRTRELYVPMIHTSLKYGQELHGDKRYRDECPDQNVSQKPFKVLPPIQLFDQMNDTSMYKQVN